MILLLPSDYWQSIISFFAICRDIPITELYHYNKYQGHYMFLGFLQKMEFASGE